jgi:acyl carrier protein
MRNDLKQVLLDVLEVDSITEDDSSRTISTWDSVRHLRLIMALEERFGVTLEADDIPSLNSVRAILAVLNRGAAAG